MNNRENTLLALFGGTGYDFNINARGYVSQKALSSTALEEEEKREEAERKDENVDQGMALLGKTLGETQERYVYDGCHRRGGGAFSYGVEQPADHLLRVLRKKLSTEKNRKLKLVLTAHSRGVLSALFAAKKLSEDEQLKKQVDVILDFRDPVPGNFHWSVFLDSSLYATDTRVLYDLSACTNIKEAHITIQEKGILAFAFSVLVPRFSPETALEVEYLPGIHDIQERHPSDISCNPEDDSFEKHYAVHLLGICQSMKLYARHGASIQAELFFGELIKLIDEIKVYSAFIEISWPCSGRAKDLKEIIEAFLKRSKEEKFENADFVACLSQLEKRLYDNLLADLRLIHDPKTPRQGRNKRKTKPILSRDLHCGGEFQQRILLDEATHLNQQHAVLAYEQGETEAKLEFKPLLGFKGKRLDLSKTEHASKAITALRVACLNYLKEEAKEPIPPQTARGVVKALFEIVNQDSASPSFQAKEDMLIRFGEHYNKNKNVLKKNKDDDLTFCTVVGYILASLFSIGIYPGVQAYRSYQDRGSAKFWQSRKEIFTEQVTEAFPKFIALPS